MATTVSQHVRHLGCHLGLFKSFIFGKIASNFLETSRKQVVTASNRNTIKNRVEGKKFEQSLANNYSFHIQIKLAQFNQINVKTCVHNWTTGTGSSV